MTDPDPGSGVEDLDGRNGSGGAEVELALPADPAYVSVLRTVTASLAARRDFTLEEIDDLRIAVDEASALLLPSATARSRLNASFGGHHDSLTVTVSLSETTAAEGKEIDESSFAWMVLAALADDVGTDLVNGRLSVTLSKTRTPHTR
ncbi:anti-sigma factor [Jatrophihabitans sp. DSM 45814]